MLNDTELSKEKSLNIEGIVLPVGHEKLKKCYSPVRGLERSSGRATNRIVTSFPKWSRFYKLSDVILRGPAVNHVASFTDT